jgi:predicted HTH transcriptional regulator
MIQSNWQVMKMIFKEKSNMVEYKKMLPNDSIRWLKTIVSFSNTAGGELIIGIEDKSLKVKGINEVRSIFEQKIIETIYNCIEPKPIVNIVFKNINDSDIAIIQVAKGNERPYFIKKQGLEEGCYIRYGSTDQKATNAQRTELMYNKKNETFTSKLYENKGKLLKVNEVNINDFLVEINKRVKTDKSISLNKLLEWSLIKQKFNDNYVTNGLILLLDNRFNYSYLKIGFFGGENKTNLIKDENINGTIIEQYDETMKFLLKNLKTEYKFGVLREQQYKVPEVALREVIANAIVHRNYLEELPIRISIFNDRIEVFSPGTFFDGLQLEDVLSGISKLRNPNISEIFYHLGIIEKWGSGIAKANKSLKDNSMKPLIFEVSSIHGVNVIIKFEKESFKETFNEELDEKNYLLKKQTFTRKDLEKDLNFTLNQARYQIEKWLVENKITKQGGGPKTNYKVNK